MSKPINPRLKNEMYFFIKGGEDYIAARCLLLNQFHQQGGGLMAQSVEKMLKAHTKANKLDARKTHKLCELSANLSSHIDLSRYEPILSKLDDMYQARYIDNGVSWEFSSSDINICDDLLFDLHFKYKNTDHIQTCGLMTPIHLFGKGALRRKHIRNNQLQYLSIKNLRLAKDLELILEASQEYLLTRLIPHNASSYEPVPIGTLISDFHKIVT